MNRLFLVLGATLIASLAMAQDRIAPAANAEVYLIAPRNGATVIRAVNKLSSNPKLFLTTTHFHPEHAGGEPGFPPPPHPWLPAMLFALACVP